MPWGVDPHTVCARHQIDSKNGALAHFRRTSFNRRGPCLAGGAMARITGLLFALAVTGCYNPSLSNPGFYCHADDNPACPDGQKCQDGRCVALDFQGSTGGQDGGVGGGPTGDMAM